MDYDSLWLVLWGLKQLRTDELFQADLFVICSVDELVVFPTRHSHSQHALIHPGPFVGLTAASTATFDCCAIGVVFFIGTCYSGRWGLCFGHCACF